MLRRCLQVLNRRGWIVSMYRTRFHTNSTKILLSSFDKDLPNPSALTPLSKVYSQDTDILLEQLRTAKSANKVMELCSSHLDVMNAQHIVTSLNSIHDIAKTGDFNPENLLEDQIFQNICSRLMKMVRFLDYEDLITVYKIFSNFGVRNNTYIMQSILKMLGSQLNNMHLRHLTFLYFLLSKQRHNSLVDGLKLAIPLVLQVQVEQQLDSDRIPEVVECLELACRARLKTSTIQKIIDTILEKGKHLSTHDATTVIFGLLDLQTPVEGYKELTNYCFGIVSKNIDSIDKKRLFPILRRCSNRAFYHSPFFFAISKKIVNENWNLTDTWDVVKLLSKLHFAPEDLKEHFVKVLYTDMATFSSTEKYSMLGCIEYLTLTAYQPPQLKEVLMMLCCCDKKIEFLMETPFFLLKFVSGVTVLGHFPRNLLNQVLNEEYLNTVWSQMRKLGRNLDFERTVLSLAWSLQVYDQHNNFNFPSVIMKNLVQSFCDRAKTQERPLTKFLETGLGGSQFLMNGIFTQDGVHIDHLIAMRSGNYPVSFSHPEQNEVHANLHTSVFLEDLKLPDDAKVVAVIAGKETHYCRDPEVLHAWMDIKIKALSKRKYIPVVVNYSNWNNLPDREKIPYLMREIKQAVEDEISDQSELHS